jgi:hypothetical protein
VSADNTKENSAPDRGEARITGSIARVSTTAFMVNGWLLSPHRNALIEYIRPGKCIPQSAE